MNCGHVNTSRTELRDQACRLHDEGLKAPTIAKQLGVAKNTVYRWTNPAFAEMSRRTSLAAKKRRTGTCVDCGTTTHYYGKDGRDVSERCQPCRNAYQQTAEYRLLKTRWTAERIIVAIQEWARIHGEPPGINDWNPHGARALNDEARARRFKQGTGRWPTFMTVVRRFGTWNNAIKAAGFTPRAPHGGAGNQHRRRKTPA